MAVVWFYKLMGEEVGPLSTSDLRSHAQEGKVTPDTFVRRGDSDGWVSAETIKGLFENPPPRTANEPDFPLEWGDALTLPVIRREQLPEDLRDKPHPDETIHHFGYIDAKGGCAKPSRAKQWILVTNKRILFEASVKEGAGQAGKFVHQSGSIPMSKVSYVGTATTQELQGCMRVQVTNLRISSGGGDIILAIPTKQEAQRAQEVIDGILSQSK